jgi:hypothetical protein
MTEPLPNEMNQLHFANRPDSFFTYFFNNTGEMIDLCGFSVDFLFLLYVSALIEDLLNLLLIFLFPNQEECHQLLEVYLGLLQVLLPLLLLSVKFDVIHPSPPLKKIGKVVSLFIGFVFEGRFVVVVYNSVLLLFFFFEDLEGTVLSAKR